MLEYPRPTYPGDFVSCNYYQHPDAYYSLVMDDSDPPTSQNASLSLSHDGLANNILYEVSFGPFFFSVNDPAEESLLVAMFYDDNQFMQIHLEHHLSPSVGSQTVPILKGYFLPSAIYPDVSVIPNHDVTVHFQVTGTMLSEIQYGIFYNPTIFAIRPVDQADNDNFRLVNWDDYAS